VTCVVGVRGRRGVLLAGDSQISTDTTKRQIKQPKTYQLSELLAIAYCGSGRLGQILTFHLEELDDPPLGRDEERWIVRDFVPFLRDATEQAGHLHIRHNVEHLGDSAFLLAVRGRLFTVDSDLGVNEERLAYSSLGSGEDVAIGAMRAAAGDVEDPLPDARLEKIATIGIKASSEFTNFVGGRITTVKTAIYTVDERDLARRICLRR
jgi:20S proteasome alpha/beta subunit